MESRNKAPSPSAEIDSDRQVIAYLHPSGFAMLRPESSALFPPPLDARRMRHPLPRPAQSHQHPRQAPRRPTEMDQRNLLEGAKPPQHSLQKTPIPPHASQQNQSLHRPRTHRSALGNRLQDAERTHHTVQVNPTPTPPLTPSTSAHHIPIRPP